MKKRRLFCFFLTLCLSVTLLSATAGMTVSAATTINETKVVTDFASYIEAVDAAFTLDSATTAITKTTTIQLANDITVETAAELGTLFYSRAYGIDPTATYSYTIAGNQLNYHRNSKLTVKFAPAEGSDLRHGLSISDSLLLTEATTVQAGNFAELCGAIARAQFTADLSGSKAPQLTVELTSDMTITEPTKALIWRESSGNMNGSRLTDVFRLQSVRLKLVGAAGQVAINAAMTVSYELFSIKETEISLENTVLDGKGHGSGFFMSDSHLLLGANAKITGFDTGESPPVTCVLGSVTIDGGEISGNHGTGGYFFSSGGVSIVGGTLTMNCGSISDNSGTAAFGGGVALYSTNFRNDDGTLVPLYSTFTMNGGTISGNLAKGAGGVYVFSGSSFYMNGGEISGNRAQQTVQAVYGNSEGGGGLYLRANATAVITDGKINNNYTDLSGGGIIVFNGSTLTMTGGEISGNTADTHGGAVCICDDFNMNNDTGRSSATFSNTIISENTANCIYFDAPEEHSSDCFASGGGAIYVHEDCTLNLETGTVIKNNKTLNGGDGGAIFISHTGHLNLDNDSLQNNTASGNGGAIYIEGAGKYSGNVLGGGVYDGEGAGVMMHLRFCIISNNTAVNGGAIYVSGNNMVDEQEYYGAVCNIEGGIITQNTATGKGGGVYVESAPSGEYGGIFKMTSGALYYNTAGANGNGSTGLNEAGADLYSEGGNARITVPTAEEITHYLQDPGSPYVPEQDKTTWFTNWFDDYSDQDPVYGKSDEKTGTGVNTGRYVTSMVCDRMVYIPAENDQTYLALILGQSTELEVFQNVTGENVVEWEKFPIEIELLELPDPAAGTLFPVSYTLADDTLPISEDIVTINGKEYLDFSNDGKVTVQLQHAENLTIERLPIGTKFKVVQTNLRSSVKGTVSGENCIDLQVVTDTPMVKAATNTDWRSGDPDFTLSIVRLLNSYTPEENTSPSTPGMVGSDEDSDDEPSEAPSETPSETPSEEPTSPPTQPDAPNGTPTTGDGMSLALYAGLLLVSVLGILTVLYQYKKRSAR